MNLLIIASNTPNWDVLKNHLYREGRISKEHCKKILKDTLAMISMQNLGVIMISFYRKGA